MAEFEARVHTILTEYVCDVPHCYGKMKPQEMVLTVWPPLWPHKCNRCGAMLNFNEKYPRISYRVMEDQGL